jgi:Tfp pilus assembly protein PilF
VEFANDLFSHRRKHYTPAASRAHAYPFNQEGRNMSGLQTPRPRLSVVTIVRDVEQELGETIESIREIADEIVVCDTGSTDGTVSVAAGLATKVLEFAWNDDFSAARNACLEHVTGDWVLWLDAGERIEREDGEGLRAFINSDPDRAIAFMLPIKVAAPQPNVAAEQVAQVRLVPAHSEIRFDGRVCESLRSSLTPAGISIEGLECAIHRSERDHDPQVKALRARRNLRLTELAIAEAGRQTRWLNCRAGAFADLNDHREAARLFREAVKSAERGSAGMLEAYYGLLTSLDGFPDAATAQISVCLESLEIFPTDAQLLCALGGYLQSQGRLELATRSYETAYRFGQVNPETWHLQEIASFAAVCYSRALQVSGREAEAEQVLQEAIDQDPESLPLRRYFLELQVKRGDTDGVIAQLDSRAAPASSPASGTAPTQSGQQRRIDTVAPGAACPPKPTIQVPQGGRASTRA